MAEVAASIVGLASFAGQLLDGIAKLRNFCENIKDAPTLLQDAIDEIAVLGEIIAVMSPLKPGNQQFAQQSLLDQSLGLCRKALERLDLLTSDLQNRMAKRRHWGRIYITLNKESMERMIRRLYQCKSLLQLSHQAYMSAQCMTQFDCQRRLLDELHTGQMTLQRSQNVSMKYKNGRMCKSQQSISQKSRSFALRLRTPGWSFSRVMELTVAQVGAGWTASLQCYKIMKSDDPIRRACSYNDVTSLRQLLDTGKGSIHDRDHQMGWTLFELAMFYGAVDVAKFLYEHGGGMVPEWQVVYIFWGSYLRDAPVRESAMIASKQRCTQDLERLGLDRFDHIFQQPRLISLWDSKKSSSASDQLGSMLEMFSLSPFATHDQIDKMLRAFLGQGILDPALMDSANNEGKSLMHIFAVAHACILRHCDLDAAGTEALFFNMVSRMAECVAAKANLNSRGTWNNPYDDMTPMAAFIYSLELPTFDRVVSEALLDNALHSWIHLLECAGADLIDYGEREARERCKYGNPFVESSRILSFAYGPKSVDWRFLYRATTDEDLGVFWRLVEEPEPHIPGAWIMED